MQSFTNVLPSKLSIRLLLIVLVISTGITFLTSSVLLYSDYLKDLKVIEENQKRIKEVDLKELTLDLWEFDWPKVELKLQGILNYPEIDYAYVVLNGGERVAKGDPKRHISSEVVDYSLLYKQKELGILYIQINYGYVYDRVLEKGISILLTQFFNTFLVSILIMILVHRLITRHLHTLANLTHNLSFDSNDKTTFELERNYVQDELQAVTDALNEMKSELYEELEQRSKVEMELLSEREQLATLNSDLEDKVDERTTDLKKSNDELSIALTNVNSMVLQLQNTQKELIIKEKMLATGGMVVGLAHELNTPLGVCKTSVSAISDYVHQMHQAIDSGRLSKESFINHLSSINTLAKMSEDSIDRISAMISTFKELSVQEDVIDSVETINIEELLRYCNDWAGANLRGGLTIHCQCPAGLTIETFKGSIFKVIQSLMENASLHAFQVDQAGNIYLKAQLSSDNKILFSIEDDGVGIAQAEQARIFEPFYTTKRNEGGLGLGLNIIYNIVTQALGGTIACKDSEYGGCCFEVSLPPKLTNTDSFERQPL